MKSFKHLEQVLPVYKVEGNALLSKKGDITVGYQIILPEIFTLSGKEYEAVHQTFIKAIRLLPPNSILHKQDWFLETNYQAEYEGHEKAFLSESSERFFNDRPFLNHECYLYLTKKANHAKKNINLIKGSLISPETLDSRETSAFVDKCDQFTRILSDSGFFKVYPLTTNSWVGTKNQAGLIERYCYLLSKDETPIIKDIELRPELKIGDYHTQIFTIADVEDLPGQCDYQSAFEKYSTDRSKLPISFAAPLGLLLYCNHIYNQYIIIEDSQVLFKKMEAKRRRFQALSTHSRENALSRDAINDYLNEAISEQRLPISAHYNIICWTNDKNKHKDIRNNISSALAKLDVRAKLETIGTAMLFLSGIPGAAGDLPSFETFSTFAEQATCFFNLETNYQTSISPIGVRLGDRLSGRPLHVDISDEPFGRVINNRNKFILGPSGGDRAIFN